MFCKKKATLLVAILCVFAVSFVACSKKDAVSSGAATGADGATSQEVTKADKKAEEKKAKESKKGSSEVKLPTTPNAEEDFIVKLTKDGTGAVVTGYKGKSGGVYIPATIQGLPVKEVRNMPPTLEKISFRGTPEVIKSGAFDDTKIKTITLPDSIKEIESQAFINCIALESINLPASLEWVDGVTFTFCSNLKEIIIPDSLTSVRFPKGGESVFGGCSSLPLATQARLKQLGYKGSF